MSDITASQDALSGSSLTPQQLFEEQLDVEVSAHIEVPATHAEQELGMPQLDVTTFSSQIFWLVLTFGTLYLLISRSALPRIHEVIDKRKHRIERDLDRAELLAEDAKKAKADYEKLQAKAREKSASLLARAQQSIQKKQDKTQADTDAKIVGMLNDADARIVEKQQAFKKDLVSLSEELAASVVKEISGKAAPKASLKSALSDHS